MLALMKPSSVATRSSTRGTSCGVTVVTRTSGGGGAVCACLREQAVENATQVRSAASAITRFIDLLSLLGCRAVERRCDHCPAIWLAIAVGDDCEPCVARQTKRQWC